MTVKEAILSYPGLSDVPGDFADKVIEDRSLTGMDAYVPATHRIVVALAAADLLVALANSPDFSEGRLQIKHARSQMIGYAKQLYRDYGESEKAYKLTLGRGKAKSNFW